MNLREFIISRGSEREGFLQRIPYAQADIAAVLPIFSWVVEALHGQRPSEIFDEYTARSAIALQSLKEYVAEHRRNTHLDYGDAKTFRYFDTSYFYRNLLKCLLAVHYLKGNLPKFGIENFRRPTTVIDVGSGVGTFSIACSLLELFPDARYLLLDKFSLQIKLAQSLSSHLGCQKFDFAVKDVFSAFDRRGLFIASYWLCGNRRAVLEKSDADLKRVLSDGLILIDYRDNLLEFAARAKLLRVKMHFLEIHSAVPQPHRVLVGSRDLNVYVLIVEPTRT